MKKTNVLKKTVVTEQISQREMPAYSKTLELTITALFIALTYVATAFVNIRIPFLAANGGLIHLGNIPLFIAAAMYGRRTGALAGAFGMGIFDLSCGWVAWAPFTFVICGLIGYVYGAVTYRKKGKLSCVLGVVLAVIIKVAGYYLAEGIIYGNWIAPLASIPGNVVQILVAGIIAVPLVATLRKTIVFQAKISAERG